MPITHTLITVFRRYLFENIHHNAAFTLPIELFTDPGGMLFPSLKTGGIVADRQYPGCNMRRFMAVDKIAYIIGIDDLFQFDQAAHKHGYAAVQVVEYFVG